MEDETNLAQNAALKVLYQKAQASLMFSIMKKLPSSETHPLNTLRHKYFDSDVKNEIGLKMFLIIIVTNALEQQTRRPGDQLKRLKLAQLVELLYLAFEIQDCIMEIKHEQNRTEIEDANRLCVLAGDFFMASASTQLAELENQTVVNQISKGIADMSTGRAFENVEGFDGWLQVTMLSHVQLLRKAIWSSLALGGEISDDSLVSKDNIPVFGESLTETKTELGTYFITNFMLLIHLQTKPHLFRQCLQDKNWEVERTLLSD